MKFINLQILNQLKDIAIDVSKRKCKNTMGQMFCIELSFVKETLLGWSNKKIKAQNLEINAFTKMHYERNNPISWQKDKCVICQMPLKIEPTSFKTPDNEMTYGDFFNRLEHKFLRNNYSYEQIKESDDLATLENYYKVYQKFIAICIGLLSIFNSYNRDDEINTEVSDFIFDNYPDDTADELKNRIMQTEIKNTLKSCHGKITNLILKFTYSYMIY